MIRKENGKYIVYSKNTGRKFGTYDTEEAAKKRLRQIEMFKHMKKQGSIIPPKAAKYLRTKLTKNMLKHVQKNPHSADGPWYGLKEVANKALKRSEGNLKFNTPENKNKAAKLLAEMKDNANKLKNIFKKEGEYMGKYFKIAEAESKSQQRLMGMVYAYEKGELNLAKLPTSLQKKIKDISKSMTNKEVKDFAETKHKGLPETK